MVIAMATLAKQEILDAFTHLGQLASDRGETIQLMLMGGSVMVLVFESRLSTRDVDVMVMPPSNVQLVRQMASIVASERGWPHDWLNDAA
jgi:predicted nucleotidyltransferase